MTALERQLIGTALGALLVFGLSLAGEAIASWLVWPVVIVAAILWSRVPAETSSGSTPLSATSGHAHAESACSGVWDCDFGDCTE
jgi:hypothetical protein